MTNKQALFVTMLFNFVVEYIATPMGIVFPLWYVFFPAFPIAYAFGLAIWFRIVMELFIKTVAGVWYAEKYSRIK